MERHRVKWTVRSTLITLTALLAVAIGSGVLAGCQNGMLSAIEKAVEAVVGNPDILISHNGTELPHGTGVYSFGDLISSPTAAESFRLENTGPKDLSVTNMVLSGNVSDFVLTASFPFTLASGEWTTFTASFNPQSSGNRAATLTVTCTDPTKPTYTVTLAGNASIWGLLVKRVGGDAVAGKNLGNSVDIDGEFIAAGAPNGDAYPGFGSSILDAGMSEEYWQPWGGPNNWGNESGYEGSDPSTSEALVAGDMYGRSVAVATIGTTGYSLVGIPYDDVTTPTAYTDSGKVFVKMRFSIAAGGGAYYWSWRPLVTLLAANRASNDRFGWAVALDEVSGVGRAIVGAPLRTSSTGRINIFEGPSPSWTRVADLTSTDAASGDTYGSSVGISGDYAIVGAPSKDQSSYDAGAAYILFRSAGGSWSEQSVLQGENTEPEQFGWSVDIDGDYAIVGAQQDSQLGSYAGAAHVFKRSGTTWTHVIKLTADDGAANDRFGYSVAISGIYAVVGTPYSGSNDSGAAYVFGRVGETWKQVKKLTANDGTPASRYLGMSVAIDGTTILVGAPYDDQEATDAGAIYLFTLQ